MLRIKGRGTLVILAAAVVFLGCQGLVAQDVNSEIADLKRKVSALEERLDASAAGGAGGVTAGIGKRPFIQSEDGKYKIEFGGRIQARYTLQMRNDSRDDDGSDRSWGELERARIRVQGHLFDPRFFFRLEFDGHSDNGDAAVTDGFIQYIHKNQKRGYEMKVGAGQWKPFFGRQEKQSSAQQLLVDRSLANEFFNIDRNVGLWLEGKKSMNKEGVLNELRWEAGVTNGFDSVNTNIGDDEIDHIPAFIAHVDVDVIGHMQKYALSGGDYQRLQKPGLTVGASFSSDANNGSGDVDVDFVEYEVYQMAFDMVYKYMGFNINLEYFGRWLDYEGEDVADGEGEGYKSAMYSHGGYVEAGYMIPDTKLQVVARGSAVWNQEGPGTGNAVEAGGGLNYFINNHNLKLSTDVLFLDVPPDMVTMSEKLPGSDGSKDDPDPFTFPEFSSSSANLSEFQGVMWRTQLQIYF